ncbi:MAG TPA: hypothetical protein VG496_03825 [Myxococcales bacterium]|nr:hypothetical protein [Myxococcales bacterium]
MTPRSRRIAFVFAVLACGRAPEPVQGTAGAPAGVPPASPGPAPTIPPPSGPQVTRRQTLSVDVDGAGSVASTPPGIACPGTCSAVFDAGTSVALTATPAPGQTFVSWFWECAGAGECNVPISADVRIGARFGSPPPNRCDGIAVPVLPQPVTRTVVSWDPEYPTSCGRVFSDAAGNLYTNTQYATSNETSVLLPIGGLLETLNAGFAAVTLPTKSEAHLSAYTPDGRVLSSTPMSGRAWVSGRSTAGVQARGGIVGIEAGCSESRAIRVFRIDADGNLTGPVELGDQGCLTFPPSSYFAGLVDAADRLLIATDGTSLGSGAIPSDHSAARWFDSGGRPLTAWFDLGPGQPTSLRPIIGGGVAIHFFKIPHPAGSDGAPGDGWVASIASGAPVFSAPPPAFRGWLGARVLGGTAYARMSTDFIDVIDPSSGETCGSLAVPGDFTVGGDGSLLHVDSDGRDPTTGVCTVTIYPNVLR